MRSTLDSLENTASLLANVEARLSAARKSSALPDLGEGLLPPPSLRSRASDLVALLEGMGHAVKALTTASQGVSVIQSLVGEMGAIVESVTQGKVPPDVAAQDYEARLARIDQVADATRYNGTGLIDGSDPGLLTTLLNGTSASTNPQTLPDFYLTVSGLGLVPAGASWSGQTDLTTPQLQLAQATAILAEAAISLNRALGAVQIRQDFTSQLIATLKSVTDESAATPAVPPVPETRSLSLATLANQAVMRLFN